ncbi:MAG: CopG family antitoxin [Planctomycetota bacterium]
MKRRVPEFRSDAEEAAFWDTHDTTEYALVDDPDTIFVRPEAGLVELRGEVWARLVRTARRRRTTPARLLERWIREKLPSRRAERL